MAEEIVEYQDKKVVLKDVPKNGDNLAVYVRPGDEIDFDLEGLDLDLLEYQLVGGDIVVVFPDGGRVTFASMALMGYSATPPVLNFGSASGLVSVDQILSAIEEVNELPIESVNASFQVRVSKDEEEDKPDNENNDQNPSPQIIILNQHTEDYRHQQERMQNESESYTSPNTNTDVPRIQNDTTNKDSFTGFYTKPPSPVDLPEGEYIPKPEVEMIPKNDYVDSEVGFGDGYGDSYKDGDGNVVDAAKPDFYFTATAHQYKQNEVLTDEGVVLWQGGGGSVDGYKYDSITNQFEDETIDVSNSSANMVIRSEDSTYFANDVDNLYLSRVLRFEPQMPEGFFVDSFSLSGLPAGVVLMDRDGNEIVGNSISKEQMILKDEFGNEIFYGDSDFITKFKVAEFTIKYSDPDSLPATFDVAIKANYSLDPSYSETSDLSPNQSSTNNYTFALKDISSAGDFSYKKEDFPGGQDDGFILAKEINDNIIKDGSGDSTIYGGIAKDVVYDGAGNDTIHTSAGSDIIYGGAGENFIDGDSYTDENGVTTTYTDVNTRDKVSYAEVKSYSLSELKLLRDQGKLSSEEYSKLTGSYVAFDDDGNEISNTLDTDMLAYYKGVYVDLEGFTDEETLWVDLNDNGVVDDNEKINALSKFAFIDETFTYNDDGDAIATTLTGSSLSELQLLGYDVLTNIEDIEGSNYNDTIYGDDNPNIISGLKGSDILDGRGGGNTLLGGDGYDTLYSGSGDDHIDGGGDTDAVNYQNSGVRVVVRLDKPNGDEYDDYATGHGNDTLYNIEDVIGSEHNDVIYGSGSTNYIEGMGGDDKIIAGKGYDFIDGGEGSDWISYYMPDYPDGATNDSYMEDIQGITVSMGTDFVMLKETSTGRLIDLIKDIEQVRGTNGVDFIWGDDSDETFWGFNGNDDLRGWNGNDTLDGGDDDDYILPGRGVDDSDGGDGIDFLDLHREDSLKNKTVQWLRLDESGTVQHSQDNGASWSDGYLSNYGLETAINFEGMQGDDTDDYIIGNTQDNRLEGHSGNDDIYGGDGDDFIRGDGGDDRLYGEAGNDTIYGDGNNDYIEGGDGDDLIYGHSVHNKNQTNNDTIDGGDGVDTINYSSSGYGFELDMTNLDGSGYATVDFSNSLPTTHSQNNTGDNNAFNDTIKNIENVVGSRSGDTITGDANDNVIDGYWGRDTIRAGDGDDTIIAGWHDDLVLDGQGGTDTLQLTTRNTNFRNTDVDGFEILDLGSRRAYFNEDDFFANEWESIIGDENSRLDIYGTGDVDSFDFSGINFDNFHGTIYARSHNGNDIFTLEDTGGTDITWYLNGEGGTDTLILSTSGETVTIDDNYYNNFENFNVADGATLNVEADRVGDSFYAHNKDFTDVAGEINFIGSSGNDVFYLDFTALALDEGKLTVDGGAGSDAVDIRTSLQDQILVFDDGNVFTNIERLELDYGDTRYNYVEIHADAVSSWLNGGDTFTLDLSNNTQGQRVEIHGYDGQIINNLEIGESYTIHVDADESFALNVV